VVRRAGLHVVALADADAARWREELSGSAWIVDALLGTGAAGAPRGAIRVAIEAIVAARSAGACQVFAVDLPSGLDCDTGLAPAACVRADVTGTFVARKVGFDHPGAAIFTGAVHVLDIGVPRTLLHQMQLT
jgi:NAD(P)H-hydrate epimerase